MGIYHMVYVDSLHFYLVALIQICNLLNSSGWLVYFGIWFIIYVHLVSLLYTKAAGQWVAGNVFS